MSTNEEKEYLSFLLAELLTLATRTDSSPFSSLLSLLDVLFSRSSQYHRHRHLIFLPACMLHLQEEASGSLDATAEEQEAQFVYEFVLRSPQAACLFHTRTRLRPCPPAAFHARQPYRRRTFYLSFSQYWPFDFGFGFVRLRKRNGAVCVRRVINQSISILFLVLAAASVFGLESGRREPADVVGRWTSEFGMCLLCADFCDLDSFM